MTGPILTDPLRRERVENDVDNTIRSVALRTSPNSRRNGSELDAAMPPGARFFHNEQQEPACFDGLFYS
jgi:hypothetical protein